MNCQSADSRKIFELFFGRYQSDTRYSLQSIDMKLNSKRFQLNDLPVEILQIIFRKLNNATLLYSLFGLNNRLNEILCEPVLISRLNLLEFFSTDFIFPLSSDRLDRFCIEILPRISERIQWFNLESLSIRRVLLSANYPNLNGLGLYNPEMEQVENLFSDKTLFSSTLTNQILSLVIHINQAQDQVLWRKPSTLIFVHIITKFTNLRHLNYSPNSTSCQQLFFDIPTRCFALSKVLELYVNLERFNDCLDLLDGRFNQLRTLHVKISSVFVSRQMNKNQGKLPNLKDFLLFTDMITNEYDQLLIPLFQRMSNLEELHLNLCFVGTERFVDGANLKEMFNCLTQLQKLTFNILSNIQYNDQINFISNEYIQSTFTNWKFHEVISCVDYFSEKPEGQYRIYSHPYRWREYNQITNHFPDGLFHCVREISLFDDRPFEHRFFLRIAQPFPLIEIITLTNEKQQRNKQSRKSLHANEHFSLIHYPHLRELYLFQAHEDYYKEFLFDTLIVLPNAVRLSLDYRQLKKVT